MPGHKAPEGGGQQRKQKLTDAEKPEMAVKAEQKQSCRSGEGGRALTKGREAIRLSALGEARVHAGLGQGRERHLAAEGRHCGAESGQSAELQIQRYQFPRKHLIVYGGGVPTPLLSPPSPHTKRNLCLIFSKLF